MRKIIVLLSLFALTLSVNANTSHHYKHHTEKHQTYVYICNSSRAYAYHSDINCSGLNHCTHGISKVTLEEAQKMGRVPCRRCYR
jgi:hypothetical protein